VGILAADHSSGQHIDSRIRARSQSPMGRD
jgi:hypothetical protein